MIELDRFAPSGVNAPAEPAGRPEETPTGPGPGWPAEGPPVRWRLVPNTGADVLLRAVSSIGPADGPPVIVVGDGPSSGFLHDLAAELGLHVEWAPVWTVRSWPP